MKTCFVAMGFGEKTDYKSTPPRVLNLDKTFEYIIEPAVKDAGLECVRADQIIHSTLIDKPMYEHLLSADVVIADLSTSNENAIYELGVRHALRPTTTIVMAESNFKFPFDFSHLAILKYEHLGKTIGYEEVVARKRELTQRLVELVARQETDSPVFLFLPSLVEKKTSPEPIRATVAPAPEGAPDVSRAPTDEKSFGELTDNFKAAKSASDWPNTISALERMRAMQPQDPFVIQQLALATYKSEQPDKMSALKKAKAILEDLSPRISSDPETLGLWGAIHKRLWSEGAERADLDEAINAYERGFIVKNDYYNGINYAFMLNLRASLSTGDQAVADRVRAREIRGRVLDICEGKLISQDFTADERFWIGATKVEALFGLARAGEAATFEKLVVAAERAAIAKDRKDPKSLNWMVKSLHDQLNALAKLLGVPTPYPEC